MKTKEIRKILKNANKWRRGTNFEMPDPKDFWLAIDKACDRLKNYENEINSMKSKIQEYKKEINKHCELQSTCLSELQFANNQKEHYKKLINEIEELLEKKVNNKIITQVIKNWIERANIDICIHSNIVFNEL